MRTAFRKVANDPAIMRQYKPQVEKATTEFDKVAADYANILRQFKESEQGIISRSVSLEGSK